MRLAAVLVLALLPACSYFPSHEDVFVPVPLSIGEARVVGGDTSWVLAERAFEVVAPRQEMLPEAKRALEESAEQFRAIFGVMPARVTVALHEPGGRRGRDDAGDSVRIAADTAAGAMGDAGEGSAEVIPLMVPRLDERSRMAARPRLLPLAPVARAWLAAYVDARAGTPRLRAAWTAEGVRADDPRLPDWLEDGVVQLVAASPIGEPALMMLARQRSSLVPLRELFSMPRPAARGGHDALVGSERLTGGPEDRRALFGEEMDASRRFAVESYGVARFLAEREGRAFLGAVVDRVVGGESLSAALAMAKRAPADPEGLQRDFERWLEEEYERGPRR